MNSLAILLFVQALVKFMAEIRGNKVSFYPDNLVLTAGATSANETLIFCLADRGEAFLLPTPYYPGYVSNIILYLDVYLITLIQIKIL